MNRPDTQNPSQLGEQVKTLSASALMLANRGQIADAEQIYRQILSIAPYHASSLSFMAAQAYSRGETDEALALMGKAIQGNPRNPWLLQSRAQMYRHHGRLEDSTRDLDQALILQPDLYTASFYKALNMKDAGDWNGAIKQITVMMQQLPELRAWIAGEAQPGQLSALALEAVNIIRAAQLTLIDAELQPVIEAHGKDSLGRLFDGIARYAGLREKDGNAPVSQTHSLRIAGLDESPLRMGWPAGVEPDLEALGMEVAALMPESALAPAGVRSLWQRVPGAAKSDLGRFLPGFDQASILLIPAGRHILRPATGENWCLTGYAPLRDEGSVALSVGAQREEFGPGRSLLASNLLEHVVENGGDRPCLLLSFQAWHPDLSPAETDGLDAVQRAFASFRDKYL